MANSLYQYKDFKKWVGELPDKIKVWFPYAKKSVWVSIDVSNLAFDFYEHGEFLSALITKRNEYTNDKETYAVYNKIIEDYQQYILRMTLDI